MATRLSKRLQKQQVKFQVDSLDKKRQILYTLIMDTATRRQGVRPLQTFWKSAGKKLGVALLIIGGMAALGFLAASTDAGVSDAAGTFFIGMLMLIGLWVSVSYTIRTVLNWFRTQVRLGGSRWMKIGRKRVRSLHVGRGISVENAGGSLILLLVISFVHWLVIGVMIDTQEREQRAKERSANETEAAAPAVPGIDEIPLGSSSESNSPLPIRSNQEMMIDALLTMCDNLLRGALFDIMEVYDLHIGVKLETDVIGSTTIYSFRIVSNLLMLVIIVPLILVLRNGMFEPQLFNHNRSDSPRQVAARLEKSITNSKMLPSLLFLHIAAAYIRGDLQTAKNLAHKYDFLPVSAEVKDLFDEGIFPEYSHSVVKRYGCWFVAALIGGGLYFLYQTGANL